MSKLILKDPIIWLCALIIIVSIGRLVQKTEAASESMNDGNSAVVRVDPLPPKVISSEVTKEGIRLTVSVQKTGAFVWIDANGDDKQTKDEVHRVYFWKLKDGEFQYREAWPQ